MKLTRNMHPGSPLSMRARAGFSSRSQGAAAWCVFAWLLLWSGYNTGIYVVQAANFPANWLQLVHGVRAFFPLLAGWLALVVLLRKKGVRIGAVAGPLGLCGLFAGVGMISSVFISKFPLNAFYWACMYGAVVVVLVAVCSNEEALTSLARVIETNWMVAIFFLLALLLALPFLGRDALTATTESPLGVIAYNGLIANHQTILGMSSTRNTGLARYAAVAGLVALGRLMKNRTWTRIFWVSILTVGLYALVLAQARTETIGFLAGAPVILCLRKSRRAILLGVGSLAVGLLWVIGFFQKLWEFGTRGQGFNPTLTGRTIQWMEGLAATKQSPWIGLGFQADRYYLHGIQLEDALFHALIQAGVLGTLAFVSAFVLAWFLLVKLYASPQSGRLPDEIPGILAFFTVMSVTESTAFYGANWLLVAPVLAYIQVLAWQHGIIDSRSWSLGRRISSIEPRPPLQGLS